MERGRVVFLSRGEGCRRLRFEQVRGLFLRYAKPGYLGVVRVLQCVDICDAPFSLLRQLTLERFGLRLLTLEAPLDVLVPLVGVFLVLTETRDGLLRLGQGTLETGGLL